MLLPASIRASYAPRRSLSQGAWKQSQANTRYSRLSCRSALRLSGRRSHAGLQTFNGGDKTSSKTGAKTQACLSRSYISIHQQPPDQRRPRTILGASLLIATGLTIGLAIQSYQRKRIRDKQDEKVKERWAAMRESFANSSTRSHEELRELTFDSARLLASEQEHIHGHSHILSTEHGPLESPIKLNDGGFIPKEDTYWIEHRIPPEAPQAFFILLAVNVDVEADASIIKDIINPALDEKLEREGESEAPCVVMILARQHMFFTIMQPGPKPENLSIGHVLPDT